MALTKEVKDAIIKEYGKKEGDVGSSAVQVALLTEDIRLLTEHLKKFKKDHHTRRGLLIKVGQRRRLLRYIMRNDVNEYKELIAKLGIRR
jgi:small subunit ribosomal protein S15